MSLSDTTASGDYQKSLEALRDRLAAEIDSSEGSAVASLAKQLRDVLHTLNSMPNGRERSRVDDLTKRRDARRASSPKGAARGVERGRGSG